ACSGAGPGAAVPGGIGRRALRVVRIADAGARSGAAPEGLGGGGPRSARGVVRAEGECAWVPFEAAGHRPGPFGVDVTAEAAEDSVLAEAGARAHSGAAGEGLPRGRALRVRIVVGGRQARRPRRQRQGDGEGADAVTRRRRAVLAGRVARVERRVRRRAGRAVLVAAVALAIASADRAGLDAGRAEPAPRTLRVHGAHGARVGAAHAVILTSGLLEEVTVEVDGRSERQADARGAAGAVGRAGGVTRHQVDDADAVWRIERVRHRERGAEQAADARAVPVAPRLGRGEVTEG